MKLEEDIVKLEKKIQHNAGKIEDNAERIQKNSYALDILKDYKTESHRLFVVLIVVLFMWFATIGYLVYVLNDIGVEETTTTQEVSQTNENGYNNFVGNDGDIINGKAKDKTN